jgi:hypothetical protein
MDRQSSASEGAHHNGLNTPLLSIEGSWDRELVVAQLPEVHGMVLPAMELRGARPVKRRHRLRGLEF